MGHLVKEICDTDAFDPDSCTTPHQPWDLADASLLPETSTAFTHLGGGPEPRWNRQPPRLRRDGAHSKSAPCPAFWRDAGDQFRGSPREIATNILRPTQCMDIIYQ